MSSEYDVIYKMSTAHNGTKVSRIAQLYNYRKSLGSPPATELHDALPAVPPLPLASLGFAGGTAGYSMGTLRVRRLL